MKFKYLAKNWISRSRALKWYIMCSYFKSSSWAIGESFRQNLLINLRNQNISFEKFKSNRSPQRTPFKLMYNMAMGNSHYVKFNFNWVAVRRTYVFTLQEVEKNLPDIEKSRDTIWTIRSRTASCFKRQVAIFQLRSSYKLHKGYTWFEQSSVIIVV